MRSNRLPRSYKKYWHVLLNHLKIKSGTTMKRIREVWKFVELVAVVDRLYPPADLVHRGSWKKAGYYYKFVCSKGRGPNRRELQIAVVGILMYIFSRAKITFLEV